MAETDISHEFGREPGFSSLVFGPEHSHMLHIYNLDSNTNTSHHYNTRSKCKAATAGRQAEVNTIITHL